MRSFTLAVADWLLVAEALFYQGHRLKRWQDPSWEAALFLDRRLREGVEGRRGLLEVRLGDEAVRLIRSALLAEAEASWRLKQDGSQAERLARAFVGEPDGAATPFGERSDVA